MNHTAYDVMREYMIEGAELDGPYQFPMMPRYTGRPGTDTVDFKDSFDRRIKNHRDLTVNFYIHDNEFEKIWNCPDKYIEHLKCFSSVTAPDFSMAVGEGGMPFAMNIWQKYRNHAIAHYLHMNGIRVIPNVNIPPEYCYDWIFDGIPKKSTVVIKSQLGQPITAYSGDEVYWKIPKKLPKMTKLMIDGKALYIHRANFQIIDTALLK